jgi:hypothetical protein
MRLELDMTGMTLYILKYPFCYFCVTECEIPNELLLLLETSIYVVGGKKPPSSNPVQDREFSLIDRNNPHFKFAMQNSCSPSLMYLSKPSSPTCSSLDSFKVF